MSVHPSASLSAFALLATLFASTAGAQSCNTDFDCFNAAVPVCLAGTCAAGPSECTGDDAADGGNGDDGPTAARGLTPTVATPASATGAICGTPAYEADWYKSTASQGEGLSATLSWTGADNLDLAVFSSAGEAQGFSLHQSPETVTLSYLPAGSYYIRVVNSTVPASAAATAYVIEVAVTSPQVCTNSTDCASTFSTQLFRSSCLAGSCRASASVDLPLGSACDHDGNCASGLCSYLPFESGAQRSVCTSTCTSDSDCASVGAGLHCTQGLTPNRCVAACSNNLECGADTVSPLVDLGQPWSYYTCTVASATCLNDPIFANGFEP